MVQRRRDLYRFLFAALVVVPLLLVCGEVSGESEEALVEKARVKIMLREYAEAAAILEKAGQQYPSSTKVAQTAVSLHEQMKGETKKLINAYKNLIKLLKLKEVTDGSLDAEDSRLLRETEKKLAEVAEIRLGVDDAIERFAGEGIKICRALAKRKKHVESSFVYQRLSAVTKGGELEDEVKKLAGELKGKAALVKMPSGGSATGDEKTQKLILNAQKSLRKGRYDEARLACMAALEADPGLAPARALLCDIADKTKDTAGVLTHGLSYLLFPAEAQSVKRAQGIEKRVVKASPGLRAFFEATARAADEIGRLTKKAIRGKKSSDVEYALERLLLLTHRTKKVDSILSKASSLPEPKIKDPVRRGTIIFSENFVKRNNLWYMQDGHAWFESGKYIIKSTDAISNCRTAGHLRPADFYLECEVQLISKKKERTAGGLCFKVQSNSSFYIFLISPEGKFGIWVVVNLEQEDLTGKERGPEDELTCCVRSKYIKKGKAKNLLAVAFVGKKLFCYINRRLVWTGEDDTFGAGTFGCSVNGGTNIYTFDNFKLYDASLPGK